MAITLDTLTLPYDLMWEDKYQWSKIKASGRYTVGGKFNIQESSVISNQGRPITLYSENAWIEHSDVDILFTWLNTIDKQMTLTLHDASIYTVRFRAWDSPSIEADPVKKIAELASDDEYILRLKLVAIT